MTALADTSILLRLPTPADSRHEETQDALRVMRGRGERLVIARQNAIEFRNVASRPVAVRGLGMTPRQADAQLDIMEALFTSLPERDDVYVEWRDLCRRAGVSGKQVHDTRLVAVCVVAGIQVILTWNPRDFARFIPFVPGLAVLTPADVLAGQE